MKKMKFTQFEKLKFTKFENNKSGFIIFVVGEI